MFNLGNSSVKCLGCPPDPQSADGSVADPAGPGDPGNIMGGGQKRLEVIPFG